MMRLRHVLSLVLSVALVAPLGASLSAQSPTLVFLVRHAEKEAQPAADPPLTLAGQVRAKALIDVLAQSGISAIITTQFLRTKSTAAPLAEKLGLTMETVATTNATHAQAVADAVRKHAGKAVLVVGHSNTINTITTALGGPKLPDLCDGDYDQLFVLEIPATGTPRFTRARYGALAADAACAKMQVP